MEPRTPQKRPELDLSRFLQGSEDWDLDDLSFSPIRPAAPRILPQPPYTPDPCTRCVVEAVSEERVGSKWRKVVVARTQTREKARVVLYLYDDWYHTDVRVDDVVNAIGSFTPAQDISLTSQSNLLILHPDILLTATALSGASQCRRKPLLSSLVRSTSDVTPSLIWGSMLHEIMQKCLLRQKWDDDFMRRCVDETVSAGLADLVRVGIEEEVARSEITERAKGLKIFQEKYLSRLPKHDARLVNTRSKAFEEPSLLAINRVLDIEEDIWSPTYGLKGKIDATVQGILSEPAPPRLSTAEQRTLTQTPLPFELKTGRATGIMEHRAQTMLYTLLLSERYGADVQDGLLFYTQSEDGEVVRVPRARNEIRGLIGVRNEIAAYMWRRVREKKKNTSRASRPEGEDDRMDVDVDVDGGDIEESFLPPPVDDERVCKRCYVQDTCFLFRKTHPNHSSQQQPHMMKFDPPIPNFLSDVFEAKTGHLTRSQVAFFRDWERLLALEERDLVRFRKELWTVGAEEREKRGRCFAGMVMVVVKDADRKEDIGNNKEGKIHRHTYTFARSSTRWVEPVNNNKNGGGIPGRSLLSGHLNVGDPVAVSADPLLALARGFILELTPSEVVVGVDHALDVESIRAKLRRTTAATPSTTTTTAAAAAATSTTEVLFRIDKDELFGGMARIRSNLAQLFYLDGGDRRRLELVVDLCKPVFTEPDHPPPPPQPQQERQGVLNSCQLAAIEKVLYAEDYALILGMPGTGKTTVIAALIRVLVERGKTILLTSHTHSAVDTILMKLLATTTAASEGTQETDGDGDFGILRLGNLDKVHPEMKKYTLNAKMKRKEMGTVGEYEMQIMSPPVVATTCLSVDHPLFSRRTFDYCIVDEASQITLPTCLGPLRFARKFVLVGDHHQLPPLVKNPEARKGGLDVSLFRRLSEAHPDAVVDLRSQYRMNSDIMMLSNELIYDNRLKCGCEEVANRVLTLPNRRFLTDGLHPDYDGGGGDGGPRGCGSSCWLETLASESCKAVFVDTDLLPALDSRVGDLVQNTTEADLVYQLTETLVRCGVRESQIGIISLYRQQVKLLQHLLRERRAVEILTADRSQGRDKDCIIISLVRSNDDGFIGDLVKDWRRMNVSFTRARSKLVIFGSRKTLQREPLLDQFFKLMEKQDWILRLPTGSNVVHARATAAAFFQCSPAPPPPPPLPPPRPSPVHHSEDEDEEDQLPTAKVGQKRPMSGKENGVSYGGDETKKKKKKSESDGHDGGEEEIVPAAKKAKVAAKGGLLKGRPILSDLIINEL